MQKLTFVKKFLLYFGALIFFVLLTKKIGFGPHSLGRTPEPTTSGLFSSTEKENEKRKKEKNI